MLAVCGLGMVLGWSPEGSTQGMLGGMWMPRCPYSGSARQMGEHTFTVWPPFLILQVPITFCELSEFWWVIRLCMWVAPVRCLAECAWRGVEKSRGLSASWLNRRRGNPNPRHVAGATTLEHDANRPGARSALPDQAGPRIRSPSARMRAGSSCKYLSVVQLSETALHTWRNSCLLSAGFS